MIITEGRIRQSLGLFIIASHFGAVMLVIGFYLARGFLFEDMMTTLALIVPMFATHTTSIVRYVITHRHVSKSQRAASGEFAVLAFAVPLLFVLCLLTMIIAKALNFAFQNFDQFKTILAVIESLFGLYVGYFITELFEHGIKVRTRISATKIERRRWGSMFYSRASLQL